MATALQQRVWNALTKIPRGSVTTYGLIAKHLKTNAVRAVASAVGKNPNAPLVPCHRVVPKTWRLGNYSGPGGSQKKRALLEQEGVVVTNDRICDFADVLYTY